MPFDWSLVDKGAWFYDTPDGSTPPPVGDGKTYSRALGWQSPEGNFYSQERWVRDWYSAVTWNGEEYLALDVAGEVTKTSELPLPGMINPRTGLEYSPRSHFEIWATPRPNWPPANQVVYDGRSKDYYWWDTVSQSWKELEWFFQCEGDDELPRPGYRTGAAHIIVYHDIKVVWVGTHWQRYQHDMLDLGENDTLHLPEGFLAQNEETHQQIITGIITSTGAINSRLDAEVSELNQSITNLVNQVDGFSDPNRITLAEAYSLKTALFQLHQESEDIIDVAGLLEIEAPLNAFVLALDSLDDILSSWIDKETYPLDISDTQRSAIQNAFGVVQNTKSILINAIAAARVNGVTVDLGEFEEYVNGELSEVDSALNGLDTKILDFSSDLKITLAESNALKLSLQQVVAESEDLIDLATSLDVGSEKTDYQAALTALDTTLDAWTDQASYPLSITQAQRTAILDAFKAVQSTKTILSRTITAKLNHDSEIAVYDYIEEQVTGLNNVLANLDIALDDLSSDLIITQSEANSLELALAQVDAESRDIISAAIMLEVVAEKEDYSSALTTLKGLIEPWISQTTYPLAITGANRVDIKAAFDLVQSRKSILINAIRDKQAGDIQVSVSDLSGLLESSVSDLNSSLETVQSQVEGFSSDSKITLAEANSLKMAMFQVVAESHDIIATALSLEIITPRTNFSTAIASLQNTIGFWIDQPSYPMDISVDQRGIIKSAFDLVQSAKSILINTISDALNNNTSTVLTEYIDGKVTELNGTLAGLSSDVDTFSSDLSITKAEANSLKLAMDQAVAESGDLVLAAEVVGVTNEKTAFSTAISTLRNTVTGWTTQTTYPYPISEENRVVIKSLFDDVQNKKSILINTIRDTQAAGIITTVDELHTLVTDSFSDVDLSIAGLNTEVDKISSDDWVTFAEGSSLKTLLAQAVAESTDIISMAVTLNVVDEKEDYQDALEALQQALSHWIDQLVYPAAILGAERVTIATCFENLQTTKVILQNAITNAMAGRTEGIVNGYIDTQIAGVNSTLHDLGVDVDNFSSDLKITLLEANTLELALSQVVSESLDLIEAAGAPLNITTQKTEYATAITVLQTIVNPLIGQASYPITITESDRAVIKSGFETVQNKKSILINTIRNIQAGGITTSLGQLSDLVTESFDDVNSAIGVLNTDVDKFSSDGWITLSEANSLKVALRQVMSEASDIITIAVSCEIGTEKDDYYIALNNLVQAFNPWLTPLVMGTDDITWASSSGIGETHVDTNNYPCEVLPETRVNIKAAFESVQVAKTKLQSAITTTLDTNVTDAVTQYTDTQVAQVNASLTDLSGKFTTFASNGAITSIEANALKLALAQVIAESLDIINVGSVVPVERNNYQIALNSLEDLLDVWIDQPSYPIDISQAQRDAIKAAFENLQNKKSILINAIREHQNTSLVDGINVVKQDLIDAFKSADIPLDSTWMSKVAGARIVYESPTQIGMESTVKGSIGGVWVNGELVVDDEVGVDAITVSNTIPSLLWSNTAQTLTPAALTINTEYYIYLANHDTRFNGILFSGVTYNFAGKLFLSQTPDISGYLGNIGAGLNARIVGKISTDGSTPPKFRREVDISWISRTTSFPETYRDYCDYRLEFVDESNIRLQLVDGEYGQISIAGQLLTFGDNISLSSSTARLSWIGDVLSADYSTIAPSSMYYIYALDDANQWNFNAINPNTGIPWRESDVNSTGNYFASKDLRKRIALSLKAPESGVLSQVWPGYYARHIGYVRTDSNGFFQYSSDLSAIRSLTLNPTYLDGLAEISLMDVSDSSFKVIRKRGSSGICVVGSVGVQTYDSDNPLCHTITTNNIVYTYSEGTPLAPLVNTGKILNQYIEKDMHVYLSNDRSCWASLFATQGRTRNPGTGCLFISTQKPSDAYLSQNFPGNDARWIGTIRLTPGATGAELVTNGDFVTSNSWTGLGSAWLWSEANQNVSHVAGNVIELCQSSMAVQSGQIYRVAVTLSNVSSGSVTPKIGGTLGESVNSSQRNIQCITASNTNTLRFVPSSDFVGTIDSVTCGVVTYGQFSGQYVQDTITKRDLTVDNSTIGSMILWDSTKIMQVINDSLGLSGAAAVFSSERANGLNVRLNYVNSTTIRLIPLSGDTNYIVFPDSTSRMLPVGGVDLTVSGAANTLYYVYLTSASMYLSTAPPDNLYSRLRTYGTTAILVGYVRMPAPNQMAGFWNVGSVYNNPQQTLPEGTATSIDNNINFSYTLNNVVIFPDKPIVVTRSDSGSRFNGTLLLYNNDGSYNGVIGSMTSNGIVGPASYNVWMHSDAQAVPRLWFEPISLGGAVSEGLWWAYSSGSSGGTATVDLVVSGLSILNNTFSSGSITVSLNQTFTPHNAGYYGNYRWSACSWAQSVKLSLIRPGSDW
jgi:hypothetical protein